MNTIVEWIALTPGLLREHAGPVLVVWLAGLLAVGWVLRRARRR